MKIFSAKFHLSRKSIFTKFLQKFGSSIFNVLNIDENFLQIQTAINILDQFHSSLCRKKICRGLNTLLNFNIHSSEPYQSPVGRLWRMGIIPLWMYDPVHNSLESYKVLIQVLHRLQFYLQLASPTAKQFMT